MPRTRCLGVCWAERGDVQEYLRFIANRRAQQIGLDQMFPGATNPFPWMSELIDLKKEKNFFETRVIEYQTGGFELGLGQMLLAGRTATFGWPFFLGTRGRFRPRADTQQAYREWSVEVLNDKLAASSSLPGCCTRTHQFIWKYDCSLRKQFLYSGPCQLICLSYD